MNLNAYDKFEINKDKTWINTYYKKLYSREIKYRSYYTFLTKYNQNLNSYEFYIAFSDNFDSKVNVHKPYKKGKTILVDLNPIWNKIPIYKKFEYEIDIELVDTQEDGEIYLINF